jgi:diguanylate cyclase (GGDEF)-like protein
MAQGLSMYDSRGRLVATNDRFTELYDLPPELLAPDTPMKDIIAHLVRSGQFPPPLEAYLGRAAAAGSSGNDEAVTLANGKVIEIKIRPLPDGGFVGTHEDITERVRTSEHIAFLASHDPLTGLPNRATFAENLERGMACAREGRRVALHTVDLDRFKEINDTLGHFVGDSILRQVAARLQRTAGDGYAVYRLAGDEFTVIQLAIRSGADAGELAQKLVAALSEPYQLDAHTIVMSASVGIAIAPDDSELPEELAQKSDLALYCAKSDGRGTYRFFEPGMDATLRTRRELEHDLGLAVERGEFEVHYQPVLDLEASRISGFEALVRWSHPTRGMMYPDSFIDVAEDTGLIVPIGEWVLRQACRDAADWPQDVKVAVNLSPAQFKRGDLVSMVVSALGSAALDPHRLELEITESVLLHDESWVRETLVELRRLGITIAMDDFGTGYSSLRYLRSFPFDRLKIDRSFTADIAVNAQALAIVRATIALAQSLGMKVTAEGVESAAQLEILTQERCSEAQGFYIGRPSDCRSIPLRLSTPAAGSPSADPNKRPLRKRA